MIRTVLLSITAAFGLYLASHNYWLSATVLLALFTFNAAQFIPSQRWRQMAWGAAINLILYALLMMRFHNPITVLFAGVSFLLAVFTGSATWRTYRVCRGVRATPIPHRWVALRNWPAVFAIQRRVFPVLSGALPM